MMEFASHNLVWIALAVVSGGLLIFPMIKAAGQGGVSAAQAVMMINRQDAMIIDVRAAEEFASGHLPNARNIAQPELEKRIAELGKNRSRPVILVCQTGARSPAAVDVLRKAGFEQAVNLDGGIASWSQAGQPLVKGA